MVKRPIPIMNNELSIIEVDTDISSRNINKNIEPNHILFLSIMGRLIASMAVMTIVNPIKDSMIFVFGITKLDAAKNKVRLCPTVKPVAVKKSSLRLLHNSNSSNKNTK
jgi:hypothetical protein